MRIIYLILVIVFALFIVTFSQQNLMPVQLKYYSYLQHVPPIPTYLLIFVSFLFGIIVTSFWGIVERFRLNRTIRRLNKMIRELRKELHTPEAPPIIDENKTPK